MRMASMRESRVTNQHTSTTTCTNVPMVWHFSAFHYSGNNYSTFCTCRFCEEDIEQILERRAHVIQLDSEGKDSTFSKVLIY